MSHALLFDMRDDLPRDQAGGKAAGLGRLIQLGLEVPPFVVLSAEAYRRSCTGHNVPDDLPAEIESALDEAWNQLTVRRFQPGGSLIGCGRRRLRTFLCGPDGNLLERHRPGRAFGRGDRLLEITSR